VARHAFQSTNMIKPFQHTCCSISCPLSRVHSISFVNSNRHNAQKTHSRNPKNSCSRRSISKFRQRKVQVRKKGIAKVCEFRNCRDIYPVHRISSGRVLIVIGISRSIILHLHHDGQIYGPVWAMATTWKIQGTSESVQAFCKAPANHTSPRTVFDNG